MTEAAPSGLTLRELAAKPVTELRSVGEKLQVGLAEMGITSVLDLLEHYPRRYVDRTQRAEIAELAIGDEATIDAEVRSMRSRRTRDGKRTIVNGTVYDGTGLLELVFFNQGWRERQLKPGTQVSLFGKVESYRGKRQITNPVVDVLSVPTDELGDAGLTASDITGTVVSVYPQSGKAEVHTWQLRRGSRLPRAHEGAGFADPLDAALRADQEIVDRSTAYHDIHRPAVINDAWRAASRLKFDEFLRMQLGLVARKRALAAQASGIRHVVDGDLVSAVPRAAAVPAHPRPGARHRGDHRDLAAPAPMHRLLQGEVGSGKTVVALTALLTAVQGGYQGAFMAPTEVLAEQHELTMRSVLAGLSVPGEEGTLLGRAPDRRGAAHQPHARGRTPADRRRTAYRRSRHHRRHPRADLRRRRVRESSAWP